MNNKLWLAVDEDGMESWFGDMPVREDSRALGKYWNYTGKRWGELFPGCIKGLIGRELTWADEPVEYTPGERELTPEGYTVYECVNCHKFSMIETNDLVIPGCCTNCFHPFFND